MLKDFVFWKFSRSINSKYVYESEYNIANIGAGS